jgi:hypothetical protein
MRCSAFHPSDCMAVNARRGRLVVKRSRRKGIVNLKARTVEECQAKPTVTKRDSSGSQATVIWR